RPRRRRARRRKSIAASVGPQVILADDLAPALVVAPHDGVELVAREPRGLDPELAEALADRGQLQHLADVGGDPLEHGLRRRARGEDAVPAADAEAGEEPVEGNRAGQLLERLRSGHEDRARLARLD